MIYNTEGIAILHSEPNLRFFRWLRFFAKCLWPKGYVTLQKIEPTKKSSNFAREASIATPSKIIAIGASDPAGLIGNEGKLPWHYPEEIQYFRETTLGSPLIMGHKTFLSLPSHYLEGRTCIIFTRQKLTNQQNLYFVSSISDFLALPGQYKEMYVIGGAQIYTLFIQENLLDEFILTKITRLYVGDAFFSLSLLNGWKQQIIRKTPDFTIYRYFNPQERPHADKNT